MKTAFTFLLTIAFSITLMAGQGPTNANAAAAPSAELSGMVIDKLSGEALGGVEISIDGTDQQYYTDFDGKFEIKDLKPGMYNLIISYISYEKSLIEKIEVSPDKKGELNIRLISTK
jgi:hypothetical protein